MRSLNCGGCAGGCGRLLLVVCAALLALGAAPGSAATAPAKRHAEADARKAETELQAVKTEIDRITRQIGSEQLERDRLSRELRGAEISVARAREGLDSVRRDRAERVSKRAALLGQKRAREADLAASRAALAGQMRAAYLIGPQEPLELLLNQKDPQRAGRMFVYYSYFGRARARQIRLIEDDVHVIAELDGQLQSEEERLAELEKQHREQLEALEEARARRSQVLASVTAESSSHEQNLQRLRAQQDALEKLLLELRQAMEKFPVENHDAFAKLRGKLGWPVSGKVLARFGEPRAGGVKWDGILLATQRGAPVRAVYRGRVIYADWLPGLGLLTILDHGGGYMSLYGHNERLYKAVGEPVEPGETIGSAGDSGGSSQPELYFEIRKGGKAVDPRPWLKGGP